MSTMDFSKQTIRLPLFLCILILFLIFYPYLHRQYPNQLALLEFFFALIMISGVSLLTQKKKILFIMIVLAILILSGIVIISFIKNFVILIAVLMIELIFFAIIFVSLLNFIFRQCEISLISLYSAITSYLVLGILFAIFYTLLASFSPDIFQYTAAATPSFQLFPHPSFFTDALYFSFITLSTLGYGDWVPIFGPVKMIASLEAIIGQLFIAILIARLVSMSTQYKTDHGKEDSCDG